MSRHNIRSALIAGSSGILATVLLPSSTLAKTSEHQNKNNNDLCGSVVTKDIKLTADLVCDHDGIKVRQQGLTNQD
jgi:hypothetical protein